MFNFLLNKAFSEHAVEDITSDNRMSELSILFKGKVECKCIEIIKTAESKKFCSNYYVGVDWLVKDEVAVYVAPKINETAQETDYIRMLLCCLKHPDVAEHTKDLYEIKFDSPWVEIERKEDLLTPLLIVHFLQLLKSIVRKGLKQSYYDVEKNLKDKVKGKILVSDTLTRNIFKNKMQYTYCKYEEFGINNNENRIIKKALQLVQKYLSIIPHHYDQVSNLISFCLPAFETVNGEAHLNELKQIKNNSFFREYNEALKLASLIFKRFGYNIKWVDAKNKKTKVPPFWIDMPKLFELYVLGLLKDNYHNEVKFQIQGTYGQPDFILVRGDDRMIIDTKYKIKYQDEGYWAEDIRQLSGYARDLKVLKKLQLPESFEQVVDCLIIYPDQNAPDSIAQDFRASSIGGFKRFYKMPIRLPIIKN